MDDGGVGGGLAGGADADGLDFDGELALVVAEGVFFVEAGLDGGFEFRVDGIEGGGVGGALVELEPGLEGDGVDGGAAADAADVVGGLGFGGDFDVADVGDGAAEGVGGVGEAEGSVGVAAGAGEGDLVAKAADADGYDVGEVVAVDGDEAVDLAFEGGVEEGLGAAGIAEAFLADVGDKGDGAAGFEGGGLEGVDEGEEAGEAAAIVADAGRGVGGAGVFDVDVGAFGEDGVLVGGDDEVGVGLDAGAVAEDVAGGVDADVFEAGGGEEALELEAAGLLVEGRRGNLGEADLFVNKVGLAGLDGAHGGLGGGFGEKLLGGLLCVEGGCEGECGGDGREGAKVQGCSCVPGRGWGIAGVAAMRC